MRRPKNMRVIGLTGGIACGKSTVAQLIRERGIPVLCVDQVARDVVEPGQPALEEIARLWPDVIQDGRLDRKALGAKFVDDPKVKSMVEWITHPRIEDRVDAWLSEQEAAGVPVVVVEDAVMVETGSYHDYHKLVVVSCKVETQRARLRAREGYTDEQVSKWLSLQIGPKYKALLAQAVIENDGDPSELPAKVDTALALVTYDMATGT